MTPRRPRAGAAVTLTSGLLIAACAPAAAPSRSSSSPPVSSTVSSAPVASSGAGNRSCVATSAPPLSLPGPRSSLPFDLLLGGLTAPDDVLSVDGRSYIGELSAGRIRLLTPGLDARTLPVTVPTVEGMALIGGMLYAADQGGDRVSVLAPAGPRTVLQLRPVAGVDGVDSIGSVGTSLLVPDSARGTVQVVTTGGRVTRTITGFARPTAALALADGSLLVADENAGQVVAVSTDGTRRVVTANLPSVDDVAVDGTGAEFAITERASGRLVQLLGGHTVELANGLSQPQGLAVDAAGNLLVTESTAGRVGVLVRSYRALPFAGPQPTGQLCLTIQRAPGFSGDVEVTAGPGVTVLSQPGSGDVARISLSGCAAGCRLDARSGSLLSSVWVSSAS